MNVFLSAGEPSGDLHGSNLIHALRARHPELRAVGFGGPRMQAAGARLLYPLTELAVMGLRRVLRHLRTFFQLADEAERYFRQQRPDALILIDYPGFNFPLAQRAHAAGIPVYYFVPPQLWAWRRGRVRQLRKWCSGVLSALPFEDDWFRSHKVPTHYVGHPFFDELASQQLDTGFIAEQRGRGGRVVGLLPGSRNQEVAANAEMMLAAAEKIRRAQPNTRFLVAAFSERHAAAVRQLLSRRTSHLPVEVHVGRTPEIMSLADAAIAVSGSVTLELMYHGTPTVVVYRMKPLSLWLARRLVKLPYFTLVNLLAGEEVFPEIATSRDESDRIAAHVGNWLADPAERNRVSTHLLALRERIAVPGACERAAAYLSAAIESRARLPRAA
jgi:lipid-A-disaccharide synthase